MRAARAAATRIGLIEGQAVISDDVLAAYAADAARGVEGVAGLSESPVLHRRPVRVTRGEAGVAVEVHVGIASGVHAPTVGEATQKAVAEYLERMAGIRPSSVDVVVDEVRAPAPKG